jgi:hypothetical protein
MKRYLLNSLLVGGMVLATFVANYVLFRQPGQHTDFYYNAWLPGRALLEGQNPYEAPYSLRYPLWTLLLSLAFTPLSVPMALASWALLNECLAVGVIATTTKVLNWQLSASRLALITLLALTFRPSLSAILHGQYLFVVLFFLGMALLALQTKHYLLAGFSVGMTVLKPQTVFLVIPIVIAWTLAGRRWTTLAGFALTLIALTAISQVALPGWIADWLPLIQKQELESRSFILPTVWGLAHSLAPSTWLGVASALSVVLLAGLAWVLWRYRYTQAYLLFMVSATIIVTQIITPKAWSYDHAMLLLPFLYCLHIAVHRREIGALTARWWLAILIGWLVVLPHFLSVWAIAYHSEVPYAFLPITLGILLLCIQLLDQRPATVKQITEPHDSAR